jgi:hypothetical protein
METRFFYEFPMIYVVSSIGISCRPVHAPYSVKWSSIKKLPEGVREIIVGPESRVDVFDPSLFIDDVTTPCTKTIRPATVIRRYMHPACGLPENVEPQEEDCVDVRFDHRQEQISHGHFTYGIVPIDLH